MKVFHFTWSFMTQLRSHVTWNWVLIAPVCSEPGSLQVPQLMYRNHGFTTEGADRDTPTLSTSTFHLKTCLPLPGGSDVAFNKMVNDTYFKINTEMRKETQSEYFDIKDHLSLWIRTLLETWRSLYERLQPRQKGRVYNRRRKRGVLCCSVYIFIFAQCNIRKSRSIYRGVWRVFSLVSHTDEKKKEKRKLNRTKNKHLLCTT